MIRSKFYALLLVVYSKAYVRPTTRASKEMSIMADNEEVLKKDHDFMDPLGAKDPLGCAGDDDDNGVEFDVCYSC